jgi:hypothetical protein
LRLLPISVAGFAALSMSTIAESEHARSEAFDSPESVYKACADLKLFNQEVLGVILIDTRQRLITMIDVTKGGLNESLAHPRDIFRNRLGVPKPPVTRCSRRRAAEIQRPSACHKVTEQRTGRRIRYS